MYKILHEVCIAIWEIASPVYLIRKAVAEWYQIAEKYALIWNVPHCLGASYSRRYFHALTVFLLLRDATIFLLYFHRKYCLLPIQNII